MMTSTLLPSAGCGAGAGVGADALSIAKKQREENVNNEDERFRHCLNDFLSWSTYQASSYQLFRNYSLSDLLSHIENHDAPFRKQGVDLLGEYKRHVGNSVVVIPFLRDLIAQAQHLTATERKAGLILVESAGGGKKYLKVYSACREYSLSRSSYKSCETRALCFAIQACRKGIVCKNIRHLSMLSEDISFNYRGELTPHLDSRVGFFLRQCEVLFSDHGTLCLQCAFCGPGEEWHLAEYIQQSHASLHESLYEEARKFSLLSLLNSIFRGDGNGLYLACHLATYAGRYLMTGKGALVPLFQDIVKEHSKHKDYIANLAKLLGREILSTDEENSLHDEGYIRKRGAKMLLHVTAAEVGIHTVFSAICDYFYQRARERSYAPYSECSRYLQRLATEEIFDDQPEELFSIAKKYLRRLKFFLTKEKAKRFFKEMQYSLPW